MYIKTEIGFLEFFQKLPGGYARPARRHKHQTHFLGFHHEPPGGRGWSPRRRKRDYAVWSFWEILGCLRFCHDVYMLNCEFWWVWLIVHVCVCWMLEFLSEILKSRVHVGVENNWAWNVGTYSHCFM